MNKALFAAALATLMFSAHAAEDSTEHWFGDGLTWYQHPCGLEAFSRYAHDDRAEVRRAYEMTKDYPEMCSRLFP
jgi:hypothetical protein